MDFNINKLNSIVDFITRKYENKKAILLLNKVDFNDAASYFKAEIDNSTSVDAADELNIVYGGCSITFANYDNLK